MMISDGAINIKVQALHVFMYLQLLDFITTLVGFRVGAAEASPFVAGLIHLSSAELGVGISKLVAVALGAVCVFTRRPRMLGWINYWYGGVVIWNFLMIGVAMHAHAA
jgi:hypothetical protein